MLQLLHSTDDLIVDFYCLLYCCMFRFYCRFYCRMYCCMFRFYYRM